MKNFKKVLSLILAFVLVLGTVSIVKADKAFSDLPASHWGYSYVQTLVEDGTINGYTDGTFRPEAYVRRAEFVKMIGKTDKVFEVPFEDITGHWGYDYIMYSDMDVEGTKFYPDVAITRDDVIGLLWKRAGSPKASAPSIITNQSAKPQAAAWAYAYGIMNGDDGVNLRLEDGVTRAEAAALICRSRELTASSGGSGSSKKVFADTVSKDIMEEIYEGLNLFDDEYHADRTFTNGEIAGAAMKLAYDKTTPMYDGLGTDFSVDRPNSFAFYTACKYVWGEDRMTEEFYDAAANNLDTIAVLMFAINYKSNAVIVDYQTNTFYDDVTSVSNDNMNVYVSAAYNKGIRLDNSDNINPNKAITGENLALVLMQLDALGGFSSNYYAVFGGCADVDGRIKTEILKYPNNADSYQFILSDVPNAVYHAPFVDENGNVINSIPKDTFRFARDNNEVFSFFAQQVVGGLNAFGAEVSITFYPSLVVEYENGYAMKVKVKILSAEEGKDFDDVFPNVITGSKPEIKAGQEFYATIATANKLNGMYITVDDAVFTTIDYIK